MLRCATPRRSDSIGPVPRSTTTVPVPIARLTGPDVRANMQREPVVQFLQAEGPNMNVRMAGRVRIAVIIGCSLFAGGLATPPRAFAQPSPRAATHLRFAISFPAARSAQPLDGRIILVISNNDRAEPRFENNVYRADTQLAFGIDVDGLKPGQEAIVDGKVFGYPLASIGEIPAGRLLGAGGAQPLRDVPPLRRAHREASHGPGRGAEVEPLAGQLLQHAGEGARGSPPATRRSASRSTRRSRRSPEPKDTKYIKHVRIQSELLTKFWGRPMYLGAIVLLPEGFDEHPERALPADDRPRALHERLPRLQRDAAAARQRAAGGEAATAAARTSSTRTGPAPDFRGC